MVRFLAYHITALMLAKFTELKNINVMSKEKVELRKEVFMFMEKQGHELKLSLDGSPIPYGIVNHLIASFHEHKMEELSKFSQHDVSSLLKAEREATKEEIREWLRGEDFEGLAERL